jgi:hypothetical protein
MSAGAALLLVVAGAPAIAAPGPYLDRARLEAALPATWPCAPAGEGAAVVSAVVAADGRVRVDAVPVGAPDCLGPAVEALRLPSHPEAEVAISLAFTWAGGRLLPPLVDRTPPPAALLLFLHLPTGFPADAQQALERALGLRAAEGV